MSHSMSECDPNDHSVCVVFVVIISIVVVVNYCTLFKLGIYDLYLLFK